MNTFYLQVQPNGTITDAVTYQYEGYIKHQLEGSLPLGVSGGWFKYEQGRIVEHLELKPKEKTINFENESELKEDILIEIDKRMNKDMTKTNAYRLLDKQKATTEEVRDAKFYALKETCDNEILAGFYSPSTDAIYGFTEIDQMNMTQQMIMFFIDPRPVMWKTEDKGLLELSKEKFVKVAFEAQAHKTKQIDHWRQLRANILAAQTKEEIMAFEWEGTIL